MNKKCCAYAAISWLGIMAFAAMAASAAMASVNGTITFNAEAYVKGPSIRLGDIAHIEGNNAEDLSNIEIGPTPSPANSRRLDVSFLVGRIKSAGFDPEQFEVKGAAAVRVTTLHQEVTSEMASADLRRYIESQMQWNKQDTQIDIELTLQNVIVPDGEITFDWRAAPDYRYVGPGVFRASINVDGQPCRQILCKANIDTYAEVTVAAVPLPRGKILTPEDVKKETKSLSSIKDTVFLEPNDIQGLVASRSIASGEVITRACVTPPTLVRRNQMVTIEAQAGGLRIVTQARADSNGAEGDVVTCTNLGSKETFQGHVRRDGVVVVQ